jgi:N-acetylmuramoyl-L-alanine amidase
MNIAEQGLGSRQVWVLALLVLGLSIACAPLSAQSRAGVQARILAEQSMLRSDARQITLDLALSQPVPFRLRLLAAPPRMVLDVNTLDWTQAGRALTNPGEGVRALRFGPLPDGWARLVLDMTGPYLPQVTEQRVDPATGQALIRLTLIRAELEQFEARALTDADLTRSLPETYLHPNALPPVTPAPRRPVVMLDPGHGGLDPGAEREGVRESDLVLTFARTLREELLRRGQVDVAMTRDADDFVSLDGRLRAARAAGADVFVSIHADAVPEGLATGTVVYLLAEDASDEAAAYLAERHDRADLLSGVNLTQNTDEIARLLMSLAWQDTGPRARSLAEGLVNAINAAGLRLHTRPIQGAAFNVLRAPDMPSVLVELGFMSSPRDLAKLRDPNWRAQMAVAMADGLEAWLLEDQALQALRRH